MEAISILYGQHHVTRWSWHVPPGRHPGFTLWSVWGGEGSMTLGEKCYDLGSGDFFFIDYSKGVHAAQSNANPLKVRFVDFILKDPAITSNWPEHRQFNQLQFMSGLFDRLQKAQWDGNFASLNLWLEAVVTEYLAKEPVVVTNHYTEMIESLCRQFQRHPEQCFRIKQIASEMCCNEDHLIRIFKHSKGVTPYAYLQNCRLETAKVLLSNSNNRIGEIALAVGFQSIYEFSRFFKKNAGITPTAFREAYSRTSQPG